MKRWWVAALATSGLLGSLLSITGGCGSSDAEAPSSDGAVPTKQTTSDLVRGMLGGSITGTTGEATGDQKIYDAVANDVAAQIEADAPGKLAQIDADLRSRDGERVVQAKLALDQAIDSALAGSALKARLKSDPALAGLKLQGLPTGAMHLLDLIVDSGQLVDAGAGLVDGGQQLLCSTKGPDGGDLHLGAVNGRYGDDRSGLGGAAVDTKDLVDTTDLNLFNTLRNVDSGKLTPDPDSRLGAYAATKGYDAGTVGNAVHNAIGTIYVGFANYGQENIGRVFNSPEAKALYGQPVNSCAGQAMATLEHRYWSDVTAEDGFSPGGRMGSAFNPGVRNFLQTTIFDR